MALLPEGEAEWPPIENPPSKSPISNFEDFTSIIGNNLLLRTLLALSIQDSNFWAKKSSQETQKPI